MEVQRKIRERFIFDDTCIALSVRQTGGKWGWASAWTGVEKAFLSSLISIGSVSVCI